MAMAMMPFKVGNWNEHTIWSLATSKNSVSKWKIIVCEIGTNWTFETEPNLKQTSFHVNNICKRSVSKLSQEYKL